LDPTFSQELIMASLLGRLYLTRGPLLLFAFQAAPIEVRPSEDGTGYRLTFAAGKGQYESRILSCDGSVTSAEPLPVTAVGVSADLWAAPDVRLSGSVGSHTDGGAYDGTAIAAQAAVEGRSIGGGFGVAMTGSAPATPSLYLRFGKLDRVHFRTDAGHPDPTGPVLGTIRSGVAWNQGLGDGSSGFIGWSEGLYRDQAYGMGLFADLRFPVDERTSLVIGGAYRPSDRFLDATGRIGLSIRSP
jgi:hypothetical protein